MRESLLQIIQSIFKSHSKTGREDSTYQEISTIFLEILVQSNKAVLGQTQGTSTKQKGLRFVAGHLPRKQTVAALLQLRAPL